MLGKTKFFLFTMTILIIVAIVLLSIGWGGEESRSEAGEKFQKYKYVGAAVCMECHAKEKLGKQFQTWTGSRHARSYLALGTGRPEMIREEAKGMVEVGHGRDVAKKAMRLKIDTNCLKCHATGTEVDKSFWKPTFHIEDGVQCEACHGPGSGHAAWMKEKKGKLPPEARLKRPTREDCMSCHKKKSSHAVLQGKPFNFEKTWKKIAHPIPKHTRDSDF